MSDFVNRVEENIEHRGDQGHTSAFVNTEGVDKEEVFSVVDDLESSGYYVKVNRRSIDVFWYERNIEEAKIL